ncbi:hypothetical protein BV25DRAFT_1838121 [Artomyces pyxidatus]|uniref:Uncharacterized protein n=1 Tax=Artomyces pyxidatus TaxID=48021 RepID=A0ACB8T3F0_9AGAM|nr:hypothetical protein BV25DRAFT_1838121 [Artomyces pyxidatus]
MSSRYAIQFKHIQEQPVNTATGLISGPTSTIDTALYGSRLNNDYFVSPDSFCPSGCFFPQMSYASPCDQPRSHEDPLVLTRAVGADHGSPALLSRVTPELEPFHQGSGDGQRQRDDSNISTDPVDDRGLFRLADPVVVRTSPQPLSTHHPSLDESSTPSVYTSSSEGSDEDDQPPIQAAPSTSQDRFLQRLSSVTSRKTRIRASGVKVPIKSASSKVGSQGWSAQSLPLHGHAEPGLCPGTPKWKETQHDLM